MWDQVRVDGGKEFVLICHVQDILRNYRNNMLRDPYKVTKSTEVCNLLLFFRLYIYFAISLKTVKVPGAFD